MFFEKKPKQNEEKKISRRDMLKWTGAAVIGGVIGAQTEAKETMSPFEMAEEYTRLQEQFEIICWFCQSKEISFTPKTRCSTVSSAEGCVRTTFFTEPFRCLFNSSFFSKAPVASTTTSTWY